LNTLPDTQNRALDSHRTSATAGSNRKFQWVILCAHYELANQEPTRQRSLVGYRSARWSRRLWAEQIQLLIADSRNFHDRARNKMFRRHTHGWWCSHWIASNSGHNSTTICWHESSISWVQRRNECFARINDSRCRI